LIATSRERTTKVCIIVLGCTRDAVGTGERSAFVVSENDSGLDDSASVLNDSACDVVDDMPDRRVRVRRTPD